MAARVFQCLVWCWLRSMSHHTDIFNGLIYSARWVTGFLKNIQTRHNLSLVDGGRIQGNARCSSRADLVEKSTDYIWRLITFQQFIWKLISFFMKGRGMLELIIISWEDRERFCYNKTCFEKSCNLLIFWQTLAKKEFPAFLVCQVGSSKHTLSNLREDIEICTDLQ